MMLAASLFFLGLFTTQSDFVWAVLLAHMIFAFGVFALYRLQRNDNDMTAIWQIIGIAGVLGVIVIVLQGQPPSLRAFPEAPEVVASEPPEAAPRILQ